MTKFYSKFILKNKKIIVIGGSGQLGFKTCEMLINAGARVINIDIFEKKIRNKNYFYYRCDITDELEVESCKKQIKKKFNSINALINHSHYKGDPKNLKSFHSFFSILLKNIRQIFGKKLWT